MAAHLPRRCESLPKSARTSPRWPTWRRCTIRPAWPPWRPRRRSCPACRTWPFSTRHSMPRCRPRPGPIRSRTMDARLGIRRYGFHGLSHAYCSRRAAEMLGRSADDLRLVICHLGAAAPTRRCAGGRCVATTMGFTPLEGLMMATRSGSIDPSIVLHVQQHHGLTPAQVETALNHQSGLLGVSGISGDMRQVLAAARRAISVPNWPWRSTHAGCGRRSVPWR